MTRDELEQKLNINDFKLTTKWVNHSDSGFSRELLVRTAFGSEFIIEWWKNIMYFKTGTLIIYCKDFAISGNWPDKYKYHVRISKNVIIPITEY